MAVGERLRPGSWTAWTVSLWVRCAVICGVVIGCSKRDRAPEGKAAATPAPAREGATVGLSNAATLLNAAELATSVTQGALDAAAARIDALTMDAEAAVAKIEQRPPTQTELIRLNAVFSDTKRALMTDATLAALGLGLDKSARAAVARYSKRKHDLLMQRLAAAGRKHRKARGSR